MGRGGGGALWGRGRFCLDVYFIYIYAVFDFIGSHGNPAHISPMDGLTVTSKQDKMYMFGLVLSLSDTDTK